MSDRSKKNYLNGAMILTCALFIVKGLGFVYKIPLLIMLSGSGWGYYNDAYQVYSLMFVISTAGAPVAIAKLISESNAVGRIHEPKKILSLALKTFSVVGAVGMLVLIFFARLFAQYIVKTPESAISIMAIAPAVFFVSLGAAFKGYFQGYKNMTPTAVYQVIESLTKLLGLVIVLILIVMGYGNNFELLACGAVIGVTLGSLASSTYMFIRFYFGKEQIETEVDNPVASRSNSVIFRAMIKIAVPVTLSSSVMSIASLLDMVFVKNSLIASGLEAAQANMVYGSYTGCCYSLFNFPPTITQTIGISVLPFISELFSMGRKKEAYKNMDSSMRIVSLIAAPCALGMSVFSRPILMLLYGSRPQEVEIAAPAFAILALGIYLVAMVYPTSVFLQAAGKVNIPLITMLIGAVLKIIINCTLVSMPSVRINGAPFGTLACYGAILVCNLIVLYRLQKYKPKFISVFLKPVLCSAVSVGGAYGIYSIVVNAIPDKLATLFGIFVAALLYVIFIFTTKSLDRYDVLLLPKGQKLCEFLTRKGLIK